HRQPPRPGPDGSGSEGAARTAPDGGDPLERLRARGAVVRPHPVPPLLPPPRTGGEEGSWRVGETRRPEALIPRPTGCPAPGSPEGVVESRGLWSWAGWGG